jgi:SDR family mycofactocin-dependent oxidoreductase
LSDRLAGKVALVTGAARGQGRSHAVALAREGADIIAIDVCGPVEAITTYAPATPDDLVETANLVKALNRRIVTAQVDVRDRSELIAAVAAGVEELGRLDIVVPNAGVIAMGTESTVLGFLNTVATNLGGVFNTLDASFPHLHAGASIILIGSMAALEGGGGGTSHASAGAGGSGYTHAKRGIARYCHDLAYHMGPLDIRVNAIHPGIVRTDMVTNDRMYKSFRPDLEAPTREDAEPGFRTKHRLPVTYIEPEDISNAVVFLASDDARFITGTQIKVDAGGLLSSTNSPAPG